jgi:hypothetical protein
MVSVAQNWCKTVIVEGCLELHVLRMPAPRVGDEALTVGLWTTFNEFPCSVSFSAWLLPVHSIPILTLKAFTLPYVAQRRSLSVEVSWTHAVAPDFVSAFSVMTLQFCHRPRELDG